MVTKKRTISVRLDADSERRLERASKLTHQSRAAFLEKAADDRARQILLGWAVERHRAGAESLSQLAEGTGLALEEIALAAGHTDREQALHMFLASCDAVARRLDYPAFLQMGRAAVESLAPVDLDSR